MVIGQISRRLRKVIQWWQQIQGNIESGPFWMLELRRQHYTVYKNSRLWPRTFRFSALKKYPSITVFGVLSFQENASNENTRKWRKQEELTRHLHDVQRGDVDNWRILTDRHQIQAFNSDTEGKLKSPWYFIHGSDPQYGFNDYSSDNPNMDEEIKITEKLVQKINNLNPKPRFVLITGDLVNTFPSFNYPLYKLEEKTFKRIFGQIDPSIPVLVACGNHDIGDSPRPEDLAIYRSSWGDDYYSFWCGGIFFLVLNSQYYKDSDYVLDSASKHEQWLDEQLSFASTNKNFRTIVLQHIPWFLNSAEELEDYFTINKTTRNIMLEKFVKAGVQKIFCGHYHRNAGGKYKDMEIVITSAICGPLGQDKPGVRIVKVSENRIEHTYYSVDDIPSSLDL